MNYNVMLDIIPIPVNRDIFANDNEIEERIELNKYCYIQSVSIVSKILTIDEFPVKDKKIAYKRILGFLAYIDRKIENKKGDTLIQIPSEEWKEHFNQRYYKTYQNILKEMDIISIVPYDDGKFKSFEEDDKRCHQFRVHDNYTRKRDLAIVIINEKPKRRTLENKVDGLDRRFINTIKDLEINLKPAIEAEVDYYLQNHTHLRSLKSRIENIFITKRDRFIKPGKRSNRIYHTFTNVSRVAREHLSIKFHNIDIVNCQPLLLVYYLKQQGMEIDEDYITDCENGIFYENFYDDIKTRDEVKVGIYQNIFFGFNEKSHFNKLFKEVYPLTYASLIKLHEDKDMTLAANLQNIEASIFNYIVPIHSDNYFTLHDAIYFSDTRDVANINNEIINRFGEFGITPKIKINY